MNNEVKIYTTTMCPVCHIIRDFLTSMNIEYHEINVGLNPIERVKLIQKTKKLTVPQTYINGKWISGFDPVRLLELLQDHTKKDSDE